MIVLDKNKKLLDSSIKIKLKSLLEQYGYAYLGIVRRKTEALPNWYVASFTNKSVLRGVDVTYAPESKGRKGVFSLIIREISPKIDEFDYLSLNQMSVPGVEISDVEGDDLNRLNFCIESRLGLLQSEYLPVLQGRYFKTESFDWGDFK